MSLVDELIQECGDSMFAPQSLDDVRARLVFIQAKSDCRCWDTPHENAIHDLANDDVPVLLRVIERLALKLELAECTIRAFANQ